MKKGHEPYRTCVGCRQRKPKKELLRVVWDPKWGLKPDPEQRAPGRGAYLCRALSCAQRAVQRKAFSYTLKRPIKMPPEFLKVFESGL